jgi:glycosyltransferase involved in cell wall biosynthesis
LKVIRLTTSLDFGGQEKKYISFSQQIPLIKNEYIFGAIGRGGFAENLLKSKNYNVQIFGKNPSIKNLQNILLLYKWLKLEKPDVVHTAAGEANFHGIIAAKLAGVPVIIAEEIGFPSHSKTARFVFAILYRFANRVICVSEAVKEFLIQFGEISPEKGTVIYNPVSKPKFFDRDRQSCFTIVSVGRLEKVKNQGLLIQAIYALQSHDIRLILVGDGSERTNLQSLIEELGLQKKVMITGFVSEPERYLAKADLFVLPSLSEGFGIAAVEAMLCAVPCLCSQVGGIPEFITEGETGWLFNPSSTEELPQKLQMILTMNPLQLAEIGYNGKAYVSDRFTEAKYVQQLEDLYQKLATND